MQQWRIDAAQALDIEQVHRVEIRMVGGRVDVVARQDDETSGLAHVEFGQVEGPLDVSIENGTLLICHERLTWGGLLDWVSGRRASAVVSVSIPLNTPVKVGVVSADAVVSGVVADRTTVKSVSGSVTLDGVRSDVTAQTVSGDLESKRLSGDLTFSTVSGDLTVVDGSTGNLRAETVSGDLTLDLDVRERARLAVKTVSGDLTLRLGGTTALAVDVTSTSGSLHSALPGPTTLRQPGRTSLTGVIGAGEGGSLHVRTVSGDVTILERVPA